MYVSKGNSQIHKNEMKQDTVFSKDLPKNEVKWATHFVDLNCKEKK